MDEKSKLWAQFLTFQDKLIYTTTTTSCSIPSESVNFSGPTCFPQSFQGVQQRPVWIGASWTPFLSGLRESLETPIMWIKRYTVSWLVSWARYESMKDITFFFTDAANTREYHSRTSDWRTWSAFNPICMARISSIMLKLSSCPRGAYLDSCSLSSLL